MQRCKAMAWPTYSQETHDQSQVAFVQITILKLYNVSYVVSSKPLPNEPKL